MAVGRIENNYHEEYQVECIYSSQIIAKKTKTFVFQGKELRSGLQKYYTNIAMIGRHFTLYNVKNKSLKR